MPGVLKAMLMGTVLSPTVRYYLGNQDIMHLVNCLVAALRGSESHRRSRAATDPWEDRTLMEWWQSGTPPCCAALFFDVLVNGLPDQRESLQADFQVALDGLRLAGLHVGQVQPCRLAVEVGERAV